MSRRGENIRKRNDGRWEGRYMIYYADGRKKYRSVYGHTYHGVKEKLLESKACMVTQPRVKVKINTDGTDQELTLNDLSQWWLYDVLNSRKYSTYRKYSGIYERYIRDSFGSIVVSELRSETVASALPKDLSASLCKSIYCVLNRILNYGTQYHGTAKMHLTPISVRTTPKPIYTLNVSDQQKLIKYLMYDTDIYKTGILVCLFMGLRLGEICALKWEDIDFQNRTLHVNRTVQRLECIGDNLSDNEENNDEDLNYEGLNDEDVSHDIYHRKKIKKTILYEGPPKTAHSIREIPIPEFLYRILLSYHNTPHKGIYFLNQITPMDPRTYQYKFQSFLKKSGIEATHFHALRHTFATNCINSGADAKSVSEILGHANVNITLNRYVHPDMDTKRNILNSISSKHF